MDIPQLQALFGDPSESERKQLLANALLQGGLGILANNTNKKNPFPAIGAGGLMGLQAYQQGTDQLQTDKLRKFKMQQMVGEILQKQKQQAVMQQFAQGLTPEEQMAFQIDPKGFIESRRKVEDPVVVAPGSVMVSKAGQEIFAAPREKKAPQTRDRIVGATQIQEQFDPETGGWTEIGRGDRWNPRPLSQTTVNMPYESSFKKGLAELDAKALDGYRQKAEAGQSLLRTISRVEQLNNAVYSGGGAGAKLAAANFLQGLGVNINPEKLANSQEFDAIASRAVLDSLGGSLGAGTSNADVAFIQKTVPQLSHSAEARQQMAEFMRAKAMREIDKYQSARAHAEKNGGLSGWKPSREVVRTGTYNGRKVIQYDDGSTDYAD